MSKRYVDLGYGHKVSLGAYVAGWKLALRSDPDQQVKTVPGRFDGGTVADAVRELRRGMHDQINQHIPGYGRGRKWRSGWFWQAWRLSRDVNTPRLIVRWAPLEFRARLAHRLTAFDDI